MTVSELIQHLQKMPQDLTVVAEGYEDGYDTIKKISLVKLEENDQKEWYVGKYIDSKDPSALSFVFINAENKADNK